MAFNPNISGKKNPNEVKDSPFLTLSQRNKEGLSSQNIFGNQNVEKAGATQGTNIFGMQEGGQVQDGSVFGQEEEKQRRKTIKNSQQRWKNSSLASRKEQYL